MLVAERMSHPVITVHPDMPIQEALKLMHTEHIRRLPVLNNRGRLVGIVSENDLLHASHSPTTSLSVWELNYLLSKITINEIMTKDVITVTPDTTTEEAARIMADNKIGGLTVVSDRKVVGVITETDLFKIFLDLFGAREPGIRVSVLVPNIPGKLAQLTKAIFETGGNIISFGTFLGETTDTIEVTAKVGDVEAGQLKNAIEPYVEKIIDIREMHIA
jgi:acetoin utilization protein AcuB